jgi:hypothetical protein
MLDLVVKYRFNIMAVVFCLWLIPTCIYFFGFDPLFSRASFEFLSKTISPMLIGLGFFLSFSSSADTIMKGRDEKLSALKLIQKFDGQEYYIAKSFLSKYIAYKTLSIDTRKEKVKAILLKSEEERIIKFDALADNPQELLIFIQQDFLHLHIKRYPNFFDDIRSEIKQNNVDKGMLFESLAYPIMEAYECLDFYINYVSEQREKANPDKISHYFKDHQFLKNEVIEYLSRRRR